MGKQIPMSKLKSRNATDAEIWQFNYYLALVHMERSYKELHTNLTIHTGDSWKTLAILEAIKSKDLEPLNEDIPFPENWTRYDLDTLKQHISEWFDWNIEHEYTKDPEFYLSNSVNEKRFYFIY